MRKTLLTFVLMLAACAGAGEEAVKIPAPVLDPPASSQGLKTAVLAGGCFWGVQGVFQHLKGVRNVLSGYAGGAGNTAEYERVSGGDRSCRCSSRWRTTPRS